jgi:hypothetical protein
MTGYDPKTVLKDYLRGGREALLWKLDGISELDVRRPLVPTGTNLLGLIKHTAHSEFVYFGETFGRPPVEPLPSVGEDTEPNADMWARPDESRQEIIGLYRRAWAHSDATIDALELDAVGRVPHWPIGQNHVTLHEVLVHVIVDTQRHAGQADIIRELIDGAVGLLEGNDNMTSADQEWWRSYRDRVQRAAEEAGRN